VRHDRGREIAGHWQRQQRAVKRAAGQRGQQARGLLLAQDQLELREAAAHRRQHRR
jgi:hypothetical protein